MNPIVRDIRNIRANMNHSDPPYLNNVFLIHLYTSCKIISEGKLGIFLGTHDYLDEYDRHFYYVITPDGTVYMTKYDNVDFRLSDEEKDQLTLEEDVNNYGAEYFNYYDKLAIFLI